jgi:hypothetical protein
LLFFWGIKYTAVTALRLAGYSLQQVQQCSSYHTDIEVGAFVTAWCTAEKILGKKREFFQAAKRVSKESNWLDLATQLRLGCRKLLVSRFTDTRQKAIGCICVPEYSHPGTADLGKLGES